MIKEIKYSGYAAVPSDYECPDGQLAYSLNLLQEGEDALHCIQPPSNVRSFSTAMKPMFLHKAAGATNLIVAERRPAVGRTFLYFCDYDNTESSLTYFSSIEGVVLSCTAIGNTLLVVGSDGLNYCLYKDGNYIPLGSRPPFVSISFGMVRLGELSESTTSKFSDCPLWTREYFFGNNNPHTGSIGHPRTSADDSLMQSMSSSVMGLLLSEISDKVTSQGLFYQPFFVRYAFRLFDGSYAWHSAPILMLPDICVPRVQLSNVSLDSGELSVTSTLHVPFFSLSKKILADGLEKLEYWSDIVTAIDVFVSAPLYTYSQSEGIQGWTSLSSVYARRKVYASDFVDSSGTPADSWTVGNHRPSTSTREPVDEYAFVGHYAVGLSGTPQDHTVKLSDYLAHRAWDIVPNEKFEESISECSLFYLFKSIPFNDIKKDESPVCLQSDLTDLSSLVTRQVLSDDWQSHFRMFPSFATVYNSRVHLCGMKLGLPDPLPIASAVSPSGDTEDQAVVSVRVWSMRNGVRCSVPSVYHTDADQFPLSTELPRWLWYPDPSAYMMMLQAGTRKVIVNLKPHPTLNGAYWFAGLGASPSVENAEPDSSTLPDYAPVPSKVYVSEATNPFVFPAVGIITVGSGNVLALCSAAKALSQGQFGSFPLYAFTTEGVWAMEVSASGSYSARQPISRDVCVNPDGITQLDSSVLFPTDRGIMLISGSQTQCISDILNNIWTVDISAMPGIGKLHEMIGHESDSCFPIAPFLDFLSGSGMIYDYVHQRIIVYNSLFSYAYVYSLKSKHWGMIHSRIAKSINSYPEALAIDCSNNLINFSMESEIDVSGLLVTRPFKLGEPDMMKTVDTVLQRGFFRKGNVKSVLYGSRDMFNWHLVNSSVSHRILNHSGTPYKYFCIALVCDLQQDESISGFSVQYQRRLTSKPR